MKILICLSGLFGGTDLLLKRAGEWFCAQGIETDFIVPSELRNYKNKSYDIVYLPTSQIDFLWSLKKNKTRFSKIVIWAMGHGAFTAAYCNKELNNKRFMKEINACLEYISAKSIRHFMQLNSCIFTDETGMKSDLGKIVSQNIGLIFPIPIKCPEEMLKINKFDGSHLVITWLGRVSSDFKEYSLKQILYDLEHYLTKNQNIVSIKLNIIGTGDALESIKKYALSTKIECEFIDFISPAQIGTFLESGTNLLVAMGTSALDGAKYGCPTAIINPLKHLEENAEEYRWIFESKGYSLGEFGGSKSNPEQVAKAFERLLDELQKNTDIGKQCYAYSKFFDENYILKNLINRVLPNDLTFVSWLHIYMLHFIKSLKAAAKQWLKRGKIEPE